jgi:hypothetical protein
LHSYFVFVLFSKEHEKMEENKFIGDRVLLLNKLSTFLDARTRSELSVDELLELQGKFPNLYFKDSELMVAGLLVTLKCAHTGRCQVKNRPCGMETASQGSS